MKIKSAALSLADIVCGVFSLSLLFILACACNINMRESPVGGVSNGSSYTPSAIGNPHWVAEHPRLASMIGESEFLREIEGLFLLPSALLSFTGIDFIPVACALYLLVRIWQSTKSPVRVILLGAAFVVLVFTLPFLEKCVIVMLD